MSTQIYTSHHNLVNLANRECGYRNVWVDRGDTARWSNNHNLVIEHNNRGTEDVCRDGRVVDRHSQRDNYRPQYRYDNRVSPDAGLLFGAAALGILAGAAIADR